MLKNIVEKIKKIVWDETDYKEDFYYHFAPVVKYSLLLAREYQVKDKELVEIAAWLHDIGRLPKIGKRAAKEDDHHILGAVRAEKILKKLNYPQVKIDKVKNIILAHRSAKQPRPKTIEEKIVSNADAMSAFDILPLFFYWRTLRGFKFDDIIDWLLAKYGRAYTNKITLSKAKKLINHKYLRGIGILNELKMVKEVKNL